MKKLVFAVVLLFALCVSVFPCGQSHQDRCCGTGCFSSEVEPDFNTPEPTTDTVTTEVAPVTQSVTVSKGNEVLTLDFFLLLRSLNLIL